MTKLADESSRCPNCDEDELDGDRCLYCGWEQEAVPEILAALRQPVADEAYALVCRAGNAVPFVACYDANDNEWTSWNAHYERGGKQLIPTHWQPLPEPPAIERGDWKDG